MSVSGSYVIRGVKNVVLRPCGDPNCKAAAEGTLHWLLLVNGYSFVELHTAPGEDMSITVHQEPTGITEPALSADEIAEVMKK